MSAAIEVTTRLATPEDRAAIIRLAQRDSSPVPPAPLLLAERCGRLQAAVSLRTGAVVADPFRPTADVVELLEWQARRLRRREPRRRRQIPVVGASPGVARSCA
jgi:hypothetical protein